MKFNELLELLFFTLSGIAVGFFAGIYLGIAYQKFFNICPFESGIDCINYLAPFPVIGALLGPFLIFIIRDCLRSRKKGSS